MNYESMGDFEINKRVAELIYKDCIELEIFQNTYKESTADVVSQGVHITSFDFNNPSDAWPLIVDRRIRITPRYSDSSWYADFAPMCIESNGDNPLRAAMIVYLMTQEAK